MTSCGHGNNPWRSLEGHGKYLGKKCWNLGRPAAVYRALHVSGTEDLLLYLASSDDERQFAFHVLEIISLMFREQVSTFDP